MSDPAAEWRLLRLDGETAAAQMAIDERLVMGGRPTFRVFRWRRAALSFGFRQEPPAWATADAVAAAGIELVERPTGGGLAVHGSDLSCSVAVPATPACRLEALMRTVCASLADVVGAWGVDARWVGDVEQPRRITYCLAEVSPYAVMVGERKLCGLAARRYRAGWLIQGSLLLHPLPPPFADVMPAPVYDALTHRAIALEAAAGTLVQDEDVAEELLRVWRARQGLPAHEPAQGFRDREAAYAV